MPQRATDRNRFVQSRATQSCAVQGRGTCSIFVVCVWDNQTYSTRADRDGKWQVQVNTPAAGGSFQITISDGTPVTLDNVLIGEVWVCSEQSNMQMPMKGYHNQPILGSNEAVATSTDEHIRLFTVAT